MSDFDGIDRSTFAGIRVAEPRPLNIELIRHGFERMLAWRPPPPYIPRLTDEICAILWSRYASEVHSCVARGVRGNEMAHQLALTTTMSYEIAAGFVEFLESFRARPSISDLEREVAAEMKRLDSAPQGMVGPRYQRAKPAPPVPPWARERKRHR